MPEDKLPIPQFAAKIKAKYPEYKDINDTLLVQKIVAKYPDYAEQVDMTGIEPPKKKVVSAGGEQPLQNGGQVGTSKAQSGIGDVLKGVTATVGNALTPKPKETSEQKLNKLGLNVTFQNPDVLKPQSDLQSTNITEQTLGLNKPKYIDLTDINQVASLRKELDDKVNAGFTGTPLADLVDKYKITNTSFAKKYPQVQEKIEARKDLIGDLQGIAANNAANAVLSKKQDGTITREDLQEAGLLYTKQTYPAHAKRNETILQAGADLGDENKYNTEKLGAEVLMSAVPDELRPQIQQLSNETDAAHPKYALAKAYEIAGAYNHRQDNKATNGFWRTRPTIGLMKKWVNEPEFQKMFAGNEVAFEQLKNQLANTPDELNNFKADDVPVSGGLNRFSQAIGGQLENVGNIFRSDVSRQQSNMNPTLGRGTFTGNYRLPGEATPLIQRQNELEDVKKERQLTPEENKELEALNRSTKVRTGWGKFLDASSDVAGQVVFQALGTKGLGLARTPAALNAGITTALTSYDPIKQSAVYHFPDNEAKQNVYTGAMVLANALSERIFKDEKVFDAFKKELGGDIVNTIKNASIQNLTKQEVKNIVTQKALKFAQGTAINANQEAVEEAVTQAVDEAAQYSLGAEDFDGTKSMRNIADTYFTTLLTAAPIASLAAKSKTKADDFNKVGLYRMALNPHQTQDAINRLYDTGEITPEERDEKTNILNKSIEILNAEPEKVQQQSVKKRAEYLTHNLNIAIKENELAETTDRNAKAEIQKDIDSSIKETEKIYNAEPEQVEQHENDILLDKIKNSPDVTGVEQQEGLQYFIDKVGEAPVASQRFGKGVVEDLLPRVTTEKLEENYKFLTDIDPESQEADAIAKELDKREAEQHAEKIITPEGEATPIEKTNIDETVIEEPNQENQQVQQPTEEAIPSNEVVDTTSEEAGAIPPTEEKIEDSSDEDAKNKSILNRLYKAAKVPEDAKAEFEKKGLKYEPQSWEAASDFGKAVVDEYGIEKAVTMAESGKLKGGVRSAVFAESLTRLKEQEDAAKTDAEKFELAKKFADIAIRYDEFSREQGRDISQIGYFYKKSPLGIILAENKKRGEDFDKWSKPKEKSWKEFFEELKKEPEFAEEMKVQVQEELKKERKSAREARIKKVDDFIDKAKESFKGGAAYSTIIPPKVITTALEGIKKAYHAGEAVAKIVQDAIDYISTELGNAPWDKEKFRKEWEEKLRDKDTKKPLTDEEIKKRVLDKFRKKLNGLSDKQKNDVITRAHKKLIENGALEFEDFRKIIGDVTGRGELSMEDAARMKELVNATNQVDDAAKKLREDRTKEAFDEFRKSEVEAGKASKELNELFYNKPDIIKRLTSLLQLNTLGIAALVNNPIYNIWNQAGLRFPIAVVNDLIDRTWTMGAKLFGKQYDKEYNIVAAQKGFWDMLGLGSKEALQQIGSGLNRQDYLQKEVYGQQIRPFSAFRDLKAHFNKKKPLTKSQVIDKMLQVYPGMPAEMVARVLNLGDKPMRFAAEGGTASQFAKALGLKDMDYKIFLEFPREEAYRAYKGQGYSDAEAAEKADYVKEAIIKEGKRSTFQQDNLLTSGINGLVNAIENAVGVPKDSGIGNLAKTLTISPYIKIPSNAFWSFYNLLNPEIAILQSITHGARSAALKKKGETTKSKLATREARYWLGHAIVGMATRAVVIALVEQGVFSPGGDDDDSKKERDAAFTFDKPGTTNIAGVSVANRWMAQFGMLGNQIAQKYKESTPEQREAQDDFWNVVLGGMEEEGLAELQNGIFANSSSLLQAATEGNPDRYITNTLNLFTNIIQPATYAQASRAALDEVPTSKGDNLLDKINQEFLKRSPIYRHFSNDNVYKKRDIWGDHIPKGGNIISRMFGISKINPQLESRVIYKDYLKTGDAGFLPPAILQEVNNKKLNTEQYDRLQEYVGGERKRLAAIVTSKSDYNKKKDEDKISELQKAYSKGREEGLKKFYSDYPEFKKKK